MRVVRLSNAVTMRSRVSRKVHARFCSRIGWGDLFYLGNVRSEVVFDSNYQTLSVLKGVAPNTLTGVWE